MTVMIHAFFGLPQRLIRHGFWKQLNPGAKDLLLTRSPGRFKMGTNVNVSVR